MGVIVITAIAHFHIIIITIHHSINIVLRKSRPQSSIYLRFLKHLEQIIIKNPTTATAIIILI